MHVEGFSDTLQYTNSERMNWGESIRSQASWVESFAQARKHTQERKDDIMRASKITDLSAREEALSLLEVCPPSCPPLPEPPRNRPRLTGVGSPLQEQDLGVRVDLEPPCGWPVCREDDCIVGGIPPMSICMLVDVQGSFGGETSLSSFRTSFGDLPPRATMELTQLMYKEDDGAQAGDEYSTDRFLPPSKFMTEYDRLTEYSHVLNSMKGFYVAGHYTEQLLRNLRYFQVQPAPAPPPSSTPRA